MSQTTQQGNTRLQLIIVAVGTLLMLGKFYAYFITQSNAVLTDALESIVNVLAGGITLYGLILTAKPKDDNHPYGHGKVEFIAAGVEGGMIAIAGLLIIVKSIYNLIVPHEISDLDIGLMVVTSAGLLNFIMGIIAVQRGKRIDSLPLQASGRHLMSDGWSTLGLIIGLALILYTGWWWLDSVVAIIFGCIILITGYKILRPSLAGIMDEADYNVLEKVIRILEKHRQPNWVDIHNMRVIKYGNTLHIDCHITLPWYFNVREAHHEIDQIDALINQEVQASVEFFIHTDPCLPTSCPLCQKADCPVRQAAYTQAIPWTLENVLQNQKHTLNDE